MNAQIHKAAQTLATSTFFAAVVLFQAKPQAYNLWGCYRWPGNPTVYTNNDTPTNLQGEVLDAISEWNTTGGSSRRINHGGITGRDFASGCWDDEWTCDDDDGYNVIDWWTRHVGSANAITRIIDVQNFDQCYIAEVDIEMNSSQPFAAEPTSTQISYQSTLTHELGHLLAIQHSSEDESIPSTSPLRRATMWYKGAAYGESWKNTLNVDDINAIRARYPMGNPNDGWSPEWHTNFTWGNQYKYGSNANAANGGLSFYLNPGGTSSNPEAWVAPVEFRAVSVQNSSSVVSGEANWIDQWTDIQWIEFDRAHSMIISLDLILPDGSIRQLNFARNAPNWWHNQGWVCMNGCTGLSNNPSSFNSEVSIRRNIYTDYAREYPGQPMPIRIHHVRVKHFANLSWKTDSGGYIKNLYIGSDTN